MSDGAGRLTDAAIDASLNPPTTNYTLPGVLFFLQSSWRKAERERTSWEMERAELKSRVAVLEGELRAGNAYNADLQRRVKMLEVALKTERQNALRLLSPNETGAGPSDTQPVAPTSTADLDKPIVLKYSKGNGSSKSKALLSSYIREAATLSGTDADSMLAEFKRLQQLKQAYLPAQAYSIPKDQLPAFPETDLERVQQRDAIPTSERQGTILAPPVNPYPSSSSSSSVSPMVDHPPVPDDEIEDDDETLDSRSPSSSSSQQLRPEMQRIPTDPIFMDERGAVMRKFVEYEGVKKRGVLSRVRERRGEQSDRLQQDSETPYPSNQTLEASPLEEENPTNRARLRFALRSHLAGVRALAWHPTEHILFSGGEDTTAKMWNLTGATSGKKMPLDIEPAYTFRGHPHPILSLTVTPTPSPTLITSSVDSSILLWAPPDPARDPYAPYHATPTRIGTLPGHTDAVWSVRAHPFYETTPFLASAGADGTARVWNDGKLAHVFRMDEGPVCVEWVRTKPNCVAVGCQDGTIVLFDAFTGSEVRRFSGDGQGQVEELSSHPVLPLLFAAGEKGVRVLEVGGDGGWTFGDAATCVDVEEAGGRVASGGYDSLLHIYDINARSNLESIQVNCAHRDEGIWSVAWSTTKGRNGRGLGVGGGDGIVRVYEV